jgi:hypothetical protein
MMSNIDDMIAKLNAMDDEIIQKEVQEIPDKYWKKASQIGYDVINTREDCKLLQLPYATIDSDTKYHNKAILYGFYLISNQLHK